MDKKCFCEYDFVCDTCIEADGWEDSVNTDDTGTWEASALNSDEWDYSVHGRGPEPFAGFGQE